ncbi:hypothetical protein [Pantoea ananatis]|uniref:hypothetical protein n=1 Tax=Pantoea ananas TaxID=553 RepID=UPI001B31840D|nr:hypothetical protein [Pantoea ananatis]
MKERPILLNAEMVRAVLDGRKTQTRRIMKVQPSEHFNPMNMVLETDYTAHWYTPGVIDKHGYLQPAKKQVFGVAGEDEGYICPFGAVGDRLWVRETFSGNCLDDDQIQDIKGGRDKASDLCEYRADYPDGYQAADGWTPSIHMPRWASRITLEITGVRVERLNSINYRDAVREGLVQEEYNWHSSEYPLDDIAFRTSWESKRRYSSPQECFKYLWQSIYGEESWQANPFVWVIEFKRVEADHDN